MSQHVLVTGGNGFLAVHTLGMLLERGHTVVTTVRSEAKTTFLNKKFAAYGDKLQFKIIPDMTVPGTFDDLFKSGNFDAVLHLSSPFTFNIKDIKADLLDPAIQGTAGILDSIYRLAPTVKRVVITSSFASIMEHPPSIRPGYVYSEKDWNNITAEESLMGPVEAYIGSKVFAEKAAWDFIEEKKLGFKLATICPPLVLGPVTQEIASFDNLNTSTSDVYAIFNGTSEPANLAWTWVDVRDLALAHILSMELPDLGNERFLVTEGRYSAQQIVDFIWKNYPERAQAKGITKGTPGKLWPETGTYMPDNSKSKKLLGLEYRSFEVMLEDLLKSFEALEKALL